ncbi:MAG: GNAT family N-acetyltransferase [Pyrinomonadaceae bacterium]
MTTEVRTHQWELGEYTISSDNERLDISLIHNFISNQSYWGKGRKLSTVTRSLENSLNFGVYKDSRQIGFARVVTDYCTFAWLADVFIVDEYRGRGSSIWLVSVIVKHPALDGMLRWTLATRDAHNLYQKFGFTTLNDPQNWMERFDQNES